MVPPGSAFRKSLRSSQQNQASHWRRGSCKSQDQVTAKRMSHDLRNDEKWRSFAKLLFSTTAEHENCRRPSDWSRINIHDAGMSTSNTELQCVCTIWTDVKLLRWLRFTFLFFLFQFAGGTGPLWIPVPTKLFHNGGSRDWSPPCTCIFWLSWQRAKPRTLLRLLSMSSFYLMVFMIAIVFSEYLPLVD